MALLGGLFCRSSTVISGNVICVVGINNVSQALKNYVSKLSLL
uniref:Sema domain-containing protein n=1 Tax=Arundo donax TaxID=35708 RepID=A0A0A9BTK3_ARUDO